MMGVALLLAGWGLFFCAVALDTHHHTLAVVFAALAALYGVLAIWKAIRG